jgi:hypothetical protein
VVGTGRFPVWARLINLPEAGRLTAGSSLTGAMVSVSCSGRAEPPTRRSARAGWRRRRLSALVGLWLPLHRPQAQRWSGISIVLAAKIGIPISKKSKPASQSCIFNPEGLAPPHVSHRRANPPWLLSGLRRVTVGRFAEPVVRRVEGKTNPRTPHAAEPGWLGASPEPLCLDSHT